MRKIWAVIRREFLERVRSKWFIIGTVLVPLNIAEGSARKGSKEYRRFLDTAKGSLAELETIIDLSHDLGYMDDVTHSRLTDVATETGKRHFYGLLRKISDAARRTS